MYHYAGNNPVKYTDPTGEVLETAWDIGCTLFDLGAAIYKSSIGDHSGWIDVGADLASVVIPGLPAGLTKLDDVARIANKIDDVKDSAKVIDNAKDLHRPYIRKSTREAVEARTPKTSDGRFIDPNTRKPIDEKYDLGHKPGHEFRREKANAKSEGLTQKEFNDRMNNPDLYQIEDPHSNRSHKYELKEILE